MTCACAVKGDRHPVHDPVSARPIVENFVAGIGMEDGYEKFDKHLG